MNRAQKVRDLASLQIRTALVDAYRAWSNQDLPDVGVVRTTLSELTDPDACPIHIDYVSAR